MPTLQWLKKEFSYGYDSGNIASIFPNAVRKKEESLIGGSYRKVYLKGLLPFLRVSANVFELGPGRGSWSKAILNHIVKGELHTVDFQDVTKWIFPEKYKGRLICHQVEDNLFNCLQDAHFDFFWSFGVLCHCNIEHISEILGNALPKMKPGGIAVHQYADWNKLERYGWEKGGIPPSFRNLSDSDIWWPRNNQQIMSSISLDKGWKVINPDLGLLKRDSIIVLERPQK
jgi:phospholipid N-methyltransferase